MTSPGIARDYGIVAPVYRLPDATHVGTVALQVSDLARSLDYYQTVLGLHVLGTGTGRASLGVKGEQAGGAGGSLPFTGLDLLALTAVGGVLVAGGVGLRTAARR